MRTTEQVAIWDDFERADTPSGGLGTTPWGVAWKQASPYFGINSGAVVRTGGSSTTRFFCILPHTSSDVEISAKVRISSTADDTDVGFLVRSQDSTSTQFNQLYVSIRETSTSDNLRIVLRKDNTGADQVLATATPMGWVNGQLYDIRIVLVGKVIEVFVDGVSKLSYDDTTNNYMVNLIGTNVGFTITGTDGDVPNTTTYGSRIEDFYVIDRSLSPVPLNTLTKVIAARGTQQGDPEITEEQLSGLSMMTDVNGVEVDVRKTSSSPAGYYLCRDSTFDRTSPTGATGTNLNVPTATWVAAGMTELGKYLDACIGKGYDDILLQLEMSSQSEINGAIAYINAHAARDRIIVITSAAAGYTNKIVEIRTAGWAGRLGLFGLTTTNWTSTFQALFSTYSVTLGFIEASDASYDANQSLVGTLHGLSYKVGASGITPARFAKAVSDGVDYILTEYPAEFVYRYKSTACASAPGGGGGASGMSTGQLWPR